MEDWITSHVSDYSGYHYRQFLISCFCFKPSVSYPSECSLHKAEVESAENIRCSFENVKKEELSLFVKYLEKELVLLCELQTTYKGHETLWNHRRYILHEIQKNNLDENILSGNVKTVGITSKGDAVLRKRHKSESSVRSKLNWNISREEMFLKDSYKAAKGLDWEKLLIERHVKWLQSVLLWPVVLTTS